MNKGENKSMDCLDINMRLIKTIIDNILKPLTHICNVSLQTGTFPDKMKIAKVFPLFKNWSKYIFTNYRPVSLLPQFSKILEKMFHSRLEKCISKHELIYVGQYGFRPIRSTIMANIDAVEEIPNALDSKKHTIGIFIDLKKSFDTIDHSILVQKLEKYGI